MPREDLEYFGVNSGLSIYVLEQIIDLEAQLKKQYLKLRFAKSRITTNPEDEKAKSFDIRKIELDIQQTELCIESITFISNKK